MSNYLERWDARAEDEYFQECLHEYAKIGKRTELEQQLIRDACEDNPEFKKLHEQYEIMKALLIDAELNG
jgi:hypothetical protein